MPLRTGTYNNMRKSKHCENRRVVASQNHKRNIDTGSCITVVPVRTGRSTHIAKSTTQHTVPHAQHSKALHSNTTSATCLTMTTTTTTTTSTPYSSYDELVKLNNRGVSLLARGRRDPREAIASFRQALTLINQLGGADHQEEKTAGSKNNPTVPVGLPPPRTRSDNDAHCEEHHAALLETSATPEEETKDCLEPVTLSIPHHHHAPFGDECDDNDNGFFFVYHRGFRISRCTIARTPPTFSSPEEDDATNRPSSCRKRRLSNSHHHHRHDRPAAGPSTIAVPASPLESQEESAGRNNSGSSLCSRHHHRLPLDILSSALVFNMALSHSVLGAFLLKKKCLLGPRLEMSIATLKDTSRRLYLMSLGLLGGLVNTGNVSDWTLNAWVLLTASANNAAKLLFDQGEVDTARSMLKVLWETISRICRVADSLPQRLLDNIQRRQQLGPPQHQEQLHSEHDPHIPSAGRRMPIITGSSSTTTSTSTIANNDLTEEDVADGVGTASTGDGGGNNNNNNNVVVSLSSSSSSDDDASSSSEEEGPASAAVVSSRRRTRRGLRRSPSSPGLYYFNYAEIEGFILNVMLMDQSQMPLTAKAA